MMKERVLIASLILLVVLSLSSAPALAQGESSFTSWDWQAFLTQYSQGAQNPPPDPLTITVPPVYGGDMPSLPIDLSQVSIPTSVQLTDTQRALLVQNGFVVVPGQSSFNVSAGYFITTDDMLHYLHVAFDHLLTSLEVEQFSDRVHRLVSSSLQTAYQQAQTAVGTPLETPARNAALYLAVALELLKPGEIDGLVSPDVASQARDIVTQVMAAAGQGSLPFLEGDYVEDFSQYRPRGHYAGDPTLESYFRAMSWLGRITFRADKDSETLTALLLLRALSSTPEAMNQWQTLQETLSFLVGPVDDLGPPEYAPLAAEVFGAGLPLDALADSGKLADFRARVNELPGPRVNGLILPPGTQAADIAGLTRGFRFMGQRFTLDAHLFQELTNPNVPNRPMPTALDVPTVLGSDVAYQLALDAGAAADPDYATKVASLRGEVGQMTENDWRENVYGSWLWTLQPLWARDPASYPPLMQTDAWLRMDLQSGLASWTELKHDTGLYAKQSTMIPVSGMMGLPGYVEPNPLVFARIAVVAATATQGIIQRGLLPTGSADNQPSVGVNLTALTQIAISSARYAEVARKELTGEAFSQDDGNAIASFLENQNTLGDFLFPNPDDAATSQSLVSDVASSPDAGIALEEATGPMDTLYVVIPAVGHFQHYAIATPAPGEPPYQIAVGSVFSYYEFTQGINQRMTDEEWRALVGSGSLPPRPSWTDAFLSG